MRNLGKVGVIFNGGGFLGAFSVGYIKALWEGGIRPVHIQGTSVGAFNATAIIETESPEELEKLWLNIERGRAYKIFDWKDIPGNIVRKSSSLYGNKGLLDIVQKINFNKIINSPIELQVVVCNESKGEREVFSSHDQRFKKNPDLLKEIVLASASIPGILPPIKIGEQQYSDGIYFSLEPMIETGCDTIFLLLNEQFNEKNKRWDERLFNMKNFLYEEVIPFKIKEALKEYPDFRLENEDLSNENKLLPPILKKINNIGKQIKSVASSIVNGEDINFVPHRIILLNTRTPISTFHATGYELGDIKAAIEQGYDQASILMKKL